MKGLVAMVVAMAAIMFCLQSCGSNPEPGQADSKDWTEYTVAVVLPAERGFSDHWKRTLGLFDSNFRSAFVNQERGIRLNFEYYDETDGNLDEVAMRLGRREDVYAVIGGMYSADADILAAGTCLSGKPLFTLATCEELVRAYSSTGRLWAMTETDITQSEVLLSKIVGLGGRSAALVAKEDDMYGKTFIDWYAFQAKELGLANKGVFGYNDGNLRQRASLAMGSGAEYVVCALSEISDISQVLAARDETLRSGKSAPRLLFSDTAYGADVLSLLGDSAEGIEGVAFGADPESGFDESYMTLYGEAPTTGEAQLYDAAMLVGYAAWYQTLHADVSFMNAARRVVSGTDPGMGGWTGDDMSLVIDGMARGESPAIRGASGPMAFDSKVFTNVLNTTYYNYRVHDGRYTILDYYTGDGGNRTDASLAGWNWKASQMQDFSDAGAIGYPEHRGNKALLVASSKGWENYRHQADVLAIYRLLRQYGYSDDDIVLIAEDDIATDSRNPDPGEVRVTPGGADVREGAVIDYRMSDLGPEDILKILEGEKSGGLHTVVESTRYDNLFIYWSGHGVPGALSWNGEERALTGDTLASAFSRMREAGSYRKVLMMVEACYSGGVMERCVGIPGMLFVTAANADETSKADVFNDRLRVWMSNRFTSTFIDRITADRTISMWELYYRLFINTVGSHVTVYNDGHFGNLHTMSVSEFIEGLHR